MQQHINRDQLHDAVEAVLKLQEVLNYRRECLCRYLLRRLAYAILPGWLKPHNHDDQLKTWRSTT